MMFGYQASQAIYVAAKLGIADLLTDGPRRIEPLAEATKTHALSLFRVLRALVSIGVFAQDREGRFSLTPLGASLRTDARASMRWPVIWQGEHVYPAWSGFLESVRSGEPAFRRAYGVEPFEYFERHPEVGRLFDNTMTTYARHHAEAVLGAYDFGGTKVVVDVGGGCGAVLAAVLKRHPRARGILLDVPAAVGTADRLLESEGVRSRSEVIGGDFFTGVPQGGDRYILSRVLHDWDDAHASAILAVCRSAMTKDARLVVIERIMPPNGEADMTAFRDMGVMALGQGRERTLAEFEAIFTATGFDLRRALPTASEVSVLECSCA